MTDAKKPAAAPAGGLISLNPEGGGEAGFCAGGVCAVPERQTRGGGRPTTGEDAEPAGDGASDAAVR